jgi:putative transposase
MRYHASDKTEIIRLVEQSPWPARRTLERLGVPRSSFYRWYDRHRRGGPEALADRPSRPDRVWNRIPEVIRSQIVDLALDQPELSPRELAVRFTDKKQYFVSEASVYRLLKAHDLITSPAYIVIKAAEEFKDKTTAPNQLWQTDFTYLKVTGWALSLHRAGRLLALYCRLEALRNDESAGRHRHARSGVGGFRARSDDRRSPTAALVG